MAYLVDSAASIARLPDQRVTARVKDREHHDSIGFDAIEERIRETAGLHAPDVTVLDGEAFRICRSETDGAIDLRTAC